MLARIGVVGLLVGCAGLIGCAPRPPQPRTQTAAAADSAAAGPSVGALAVASAAGNGFDFYLLNLSWSPEFCATHPASEECAAHPGFIVHGLWPQDADGSYPQHCGSRPGPSSAEAYADVIPNAGLVRHEWETHGTCTAYDADTYFGVVRKAFHEVKIPALLTGTDHELRMPPGAIVDAFAAANPAFPAGSIAVSCGNNRLTAVEVCLAKDLRPEACSGVRSCRAIVVKVTPQL